MKSDNIKTPVDPDEEMFSLKGFFKLCLSNWKWFILSLIVIIGLGVLYIVRKEPVFTRSMEVLVKDQDAGGGVADVNNAFSSLSLVSSNTKVYNELISMTSPSVIMEVVNRLDLTMNYTLRKGMHPITLYANTSPFNVVFSDLGNQVGAGFRIDYKPDGTYEIYKMWKTVPGGVEKYEQSITGVAGNHPLKTPLGNILVIPNQNFTNAADEEMVIDVRKSGYMQTVESYMKKLKGDLTDQEADVIKLTINDVCVARADDFLNSVLAVYNEKWIDDKNKMAIATSEFITDRLNVIETELGQVDTDITDFKAENQVPDIEETAKAYVAQDFKLNEEILMVNNQLAMTKYLKDYLSNPANQYKILPMNTGTENMVLEEQIGNYNKLLLERDNLLENASEDNPLVRDLNKQVVGMRESILRSIDNLIVSLNNILRNMDQAQSKTKNDLSTSPKKAKVLLSVERKQLVMQELYLFLLQKREENELTKTFTADNTRVITPPFGPYKPIAPKKMLILIICGFLGLAVPAVIIFLLESSNTKIRSKKDVESVPVPFAGEIPLIGKSRKWKRLFQTKKQKQAAIDKPKAIVIEGKRDIPNEAFRVVRSNVDFMIGKVDHATVIALTSFNPGSGKSFIAYNLGASFALKKKRVLLIDGDLRHGSISGYVNSPKKGLSNYLTGNTDDWQSLVKKCDNFEDFVILPIGHRPPNPAELLENGRLEKLIEEAKDRYDIIMIDCPPVNIVVDTQIINMLVDRTLFVVRAGLLEKSALSEVANLYQEKKLKNMSLLLNGTTTEFSSYHSYGNYEAFDSDK